MRWTVIMQRRGLERSLESQVFIFLDGASTKLRFSLVRCMSDEKACRTFVELLEEQLCILSALVSAFLCLGGGHEERQSLELAGLYMFSKG